MKKMVWPQRFLDKIEVTDTGYRTPCWIWTGAPHGPGRPVFQVEGKTRCAYVWAWEQAHGEHPAVAAARKGITKHALHHMCEQPRCVRPGHLRVADYWQHRIDHGVIGQAAIHAAKTHCARGHEFSPENTYIKPPNGSRGCRTCRAEDMQNFKKRRALV